MTFTFSGTLLRFLEYQKVVEIDAPTVRAGLDRLCVDFPDMKNVLFDGEGNVRKIHRLFLNGDQITHLDHPVGAKDELTVITAIAGGQ